MLEIKKIDSSHIENYRHISYRGYPTNRDFSKKAIQLFEENMRKLLTENNEYHAFAAFKDDKMVGIMFSIDFQMNIYNKMTTVSGLGTLAVDPFYKRKGIAVELINYFEQDAKERGINTSVLLPFRPDYYVNKGYGFLTKMNLYQIETKYCPVYKGSLNIGPIEDVNELVQLHHELTTKTHGMMELTFVEKRDLQEKFDDYSNIFVGVYSRDKLVAYTSYQVKSEIEGNYTKNYLKSSDLIFTTADSLYALLGHFKAQQDQANYVEIFTQLKGFEQLFINPMDQSGDFVGFGYLRTNTQSIGLMGKILNPTGWLQEHGNYFSINEKYQWNIDGKIYGTGTPIEIKAEHLAPLWLGAVSFNDLYRLGLIKCSPEAAKILSQVFTGLEYPINHTDF